MDERLVRLLERGARRMWRRQVEEQTRQVLLTGEEAAALAKVLDVFFDDYPVDPVATPFLVGLQKKLRGIHV